MIKRLHSNLFYVNDLERTADFYARLGFEVKKSDDGVRIKFDDFTLAFIDENKTPIKNESGLKPKGLGIYTYVEVDDADKQKAWSQELSPRPGHGESGNLWLKTRMDIR